MTALVWVYHPSTQQRLILPCRSTANKQPRCPNLVGLFIDSLSAQHGVSEMGLREVVEKVE